MATAFGAPMDPEPEQHEPNGSAAPQEAVDINDPQLTSESIEVRPDLDAYAAAPTLPDGKWRAKLSTTKIKVPGSNEEHDWYVKKDSDGHSFCYASVTASVIDMSGKFDGVKLFPRFGGIVTTQVRRDGSQHAATLLGILRRPDGSPWLARGERLNHRQLIERLVQALAGEPEAGVESVWEWSCDVCGKEAGDARKNGKDVSYQKSILGMHRFQQSKINPSEKDPEMKCPVNPAHGFTRARAKVGSFLPLAALPKH